jgi:hypothetical protein
MDAFEDHRSLHKSTHLKNMDESAFLNRILQSILPPTSTENGTPDSDLQNYLKI